MGVYIVLRGSYLVGSYSSVKQLRERAQMGFFAGVWAGGKRESGRA